MCKMKKMLSLLMSVVMVLSLFAGMGVVSVAEDDVLNYLTYEINDGKVTITGCDESISGDVVIPETIEGYPVTRIESYAFAWRNEITSITIHSYITYIDEIATGSANLKAFYVDKDNEYYSSDECGVLFNKDKTELIKYPEGRTESSYRIPDGVQKILSNSINNTDFIKHIEIPATVTEIENLSISAGSVEEFVVDKNNAYFSSDAYGVLFNKDKTELVKYPSGNSRSEYKIPDTVTVIGSYAFYYAKNLITINNSCNLEKIDESAFCECDKLSDISIPDSVVDIGHSAFSDCESLKNIEIPDTITKIRSNTFYSCDTLESITIPGSVDTIDGSAFCGCKSLSEVTIADGVRKIESEAFADCISLKKISIPSCVTVIETYAFGYIFDWTAWNYVKLDDFSILGAPGSAAEVYATENGFTFIACTHENLTDYAEIPATCANVGYTAGTQCNGCSEWISGHQEIQKKLHTDADKDDICDNCPYVINVFDGDILEYLTYEIRNGEVIITGCDKSISGSYRLPAEIKGYPVTEIGQHAFMQCSYLCYVEFPDTLRKIGYGAFWNSGLEIVKIPDSVEIIEDDAFGDCFSLKGIYTGRNITAIPGQMLRENSSLTDVFIGKNVKEIGFWGFNLSDNIENIYYEGTQEEWNQIAVNGTGNDILETANIIFNCTDDSYAVWQSEKYDSENILKYSISAGKVTIEGVNPDYYGDVYIPEYIDGCVVTYIAEAGFVNYPPEIGELTIPKSVEKIQGDFSTQFTRFENFVVNEENQYYSSIDGVLFNKDKTELLKYATGSSQHEYTIPDSVTTINEYAFSGLNCGILKLNIPYSITEIEDYAFWYAQDLCYINVDKNNTSFLSDGGVLFNKDKTELICFPSFRSLACEYFNFIPECEGEEVISYYAIPDGVKEISVAAFNHCMNGLTTVFLPESVVTIGANAFDACSSLECVNIPGSVTSVQECAFRETAMKELVIPDSVTYIGDGAFQMNSSLKSVTIPDSVNYIGDCAFSSCEKLSDIKMGDSVKNIGIDVFMGTAYYNNPDNWENNALYIGNNLIEVNGSEITEYTVKDGTVNIAGCAFYWCENIRELNLPDSVASISNYAFAGMSSVEKIDIPSGVTEIGDYTFMRCSNLREVNIPESVIKIGDGIFYWSDSIRQINYDGDKAGWNNIEISEEGNDWVSYLTINCKKEPVADEPTTQEPDVQEPTTQEPTTQEPTTQEPTTQEPTTQEPTTQEPTTQEPTTQEPTTQEPSTQEPSTQEPTTQEPTTQEPTTQEPTTQEPTTQEPTTQEPVESMSGDLDGNGKITAADARIALRIAAKLETGTNHQLMFADMNKDGKITAADARKILRVAAKLESL